MKSGALCVHCWGLALAYFERNPRSSDSLRVKRNFVSFLLTKWCTISQISHRTNFMTFEHNVDRCRHVNFRNKIFKFYHKGSFFQKTQKLLTKFLRLATSGRHNYIMITDRRKFTTKWSTYGSIVSIFTVRINSKLFSGTIRSVQEIYLPKFSATSNVRYCVLKPLRRNAAWRPIWKKSRLNWKLKISNAVDNAGIT